MFRTFIFLYVFLGSIAQDVLAQSAMKAVSRYDYYTSEDKADVLLYTRQNFPSANVTSGGRVIAVALSRLDREILVASLPVRELRMGTNDLTINLTDGRQRTLVRVSIEKYVPKANEVKIDRLTGGAIVDGLPFFPFGFYAYSPVYPTMPEEEAVRGFNMMSPYQKIEANNRAERKAYMDRAAQVGMKVNFNLLSVGGGGGVGDGELAFNNPVSRRLLRQEIEAFKDHPALLSWYISDEPTGQGVDAEPLKELYRFIKSIDPYHPIAIVFNETLRPKEYGDAMDIVMADPYPIPNENVTQVSDFTQALHQKFDGQKPVWIVPQAFGGGEWWQREPTKQELRAMTYMAMVNGAMGIQYFIRNGLSAFPKAIETWNEAGAIAHETAELTPWLMSSVRPKVTAMPATLQAQAYQDKGYIVVVVVNTENEPKSIRLELANVELDGEAEVLFNNRNVRMTEGTWNDMIEAFGTRAYRITLPDAAKNPDKTLLSSQNLSVNPSFENNPMAGTPEGFYIGLGADRGATVTTDTRQSAHGLTSLRLNTPRAKSGLDLAFYPIDMQKGKSYVASIWAKGDGKGVGQFRFGFGKFEVTANARQVPNFTLSKDWQPYRFVYELPADTNNVVRMTTSLSLLTQGSAWFDALQVVADPEMQILSDVQHQTLSISASSILENAQLYFTTDGETPTLASSRYVQPILVNKSGTVKVASFVNGKMQTHAERTFWVHKALLRPVRYAHDFSSKYTAGGLFALVDGEKATDQLRDAHWQGFETDDLDVILDLGEVLPINRISATFLQNTSAWIFLPTNLDFSVSLDGQSFQNVGKVPNAVSPLQGGSFIQAFTTETPSEARYVRIVAKNIGKCPEGHAAKGNKAWLFVDEIVVE
jgi:hypothetical protein